MISNAVLDQLNRGMEIVGTRRRNVYEIPSSVIRELIVNAIVHRLYVNPRAMVITVAVYEDWVEVTSPGGLPHGMSLEMMCTGHSRSRNKALALAFKYMNFIEEWGSGIPPEKSSVATEKSSVATEETAEKIIRLISEDRTIRRAGPDKGGHWEALTP